ncbi:MAG TPA: serine/threonine-protein kinase [Gemmataceae bacterium]|nr:serine/threonine-protein kinase [Gemmataceae bacterium]
MPEPTKSDPRSDAHAAKLEEERLAHALVTRGLVTREEVQGCRPGPGEAAGAERLLGRLVKGGFLSPSQAKRTGQELSSLLHQQIPGYQLLEKLGQGAMGTVYKARQLSMNRLVAIKVLPPRVAGNPDYLERLTREAHLAAKLSHNNMVQAIDVGSAGKIHYFIMEFVEGRTIRQDIEAGKVFAEREAVEIVLQIAQALSHAHRRGLIHRDIKPANILLTADGIAKLADLGMARETSDAALIEREKGLSIGTPYYMAPEQIMGQEDIDVRADLYSLGATLYHMVTGQVPFPGKNIDDVFNRHLAGKLTPPDHVNTALSSGLGEVCEVMMARDRDQRYQTPDDLIIDLECLLNDEPPRLARQRIEANTLKDLEKGETDDPDEDDGDEPGALLLGLPPTVWLGVVGGLLAVSFLLNVFLLLRH